MKELSIFSYEQKEIRTVIVDGQPHWVAKDVAAILGYANTNDAVRQHCKGVAKRYPLQTPGGKQDVRIIGEPDLYRLIANSKLESAQKFESWIFEEVLPTIRKTGTYTVPKQQNVKVSALLDTDKAFRAALRMAKACGLDNNAAIIKANQLARRVTGNDAMALLEIEGVERPVEDRPLTPTEIGKFLGNISGQKVNQLLINAGMQTKHGDIYTPTIDGSRFAVLLDTGKQHSDGTPVHQLKWKQSIVAMLGASSPALN